MPLSSRENSFDSEPDFRPNEMGQYQMRDQSKHQLVQALSSRKISNDKKNELMLFDQNAEKVCDNISKSSDKIFSPGRQSNSDDVSLDQVNLFSNEQPVELSDVSIDTRELLNDMNTAMKKPLEN